MSETALADPETIAARRAEVTRFTRARYGIGGTLKLHRAAFGLDLVRAPLNVALSPVFLLTRLLAMLLSAVGAKRAGTWLAGRNIFLKSDIARRIETDLSGFLDHLAERGIGPRADPETIRQEISRHTETRNAVAEITTSILVLLAGLLLFDRATPGIISLTGPLAEMRAYSTAIEDFTLGRGMGRMWYAVFPVELTPMQIILTGVILAMIGSIVTTFAGLIADPLQVLTGRHRRRLMRLLARLDRAEAPTSSLEGEHLLARLGDLGDLALSLWRTLRS
ncbi:DUF6635 family protein [Paracoccus methylarcula]|uniref:Uncharacterized protein n=1 Tax=Paracoccus methylarcula TaxID=72022 RepID=A0A3R7M7H2_9RHOB|nr:DUF6635 family protein [Paracoccus methylarcula]RNF33138.1 hypothetical protein A7A09_018385 [Paracoccus methylarcula]